MESLGGKRDDDYLFSECGSQARHRYVLSGKASQKREALCVCVMSVWGNKPPEDLGLLVSSLGKCKAGKECVISVSRG